MVRIEFLFYRDCPSHEQAWERLQEVLDELGVGAEVRKIEVIDEAEAEVLAFPGSPTIRINGADVDPEGTAGPLGRLSCRTYRTTGGRISPLPSKDLIRSAIVKGEKLQGEKLQ